MSHPMHEVVTLYPPLSRDADSNAGQEAKAFFDGVTRQYDDIA